MGEQFPASPCFFYMRHGYIYTFIPMYICTRTSSYVHCDTHICIHVYTHTCLTTMPRIHSVTTVHRLIKILPKNVIKLISFEIYRVILKNRYYFVISQVLVEMITNFYTVFRNNLNSIFNISFFSWYINVIHSPVFWLQ